MGKMDDYFMNSGTNSFLNIKNIQIRLQMTKDEKRQIAENLRNDKYDVNNTLVHSMQVNLFKPERNNDIKVDDDDDNLPKLTLRHEIKVNHLPYKI